MIRDFLGNLNFGHRMVIYRLLIALFLAGMIYYAFFFPKEGDRAMRRAAEAMKRAQSWKIESDQDLPQNSSHLHILREVQCPSNSRMTTEQTQIRSGVTSGWTLVNLTIGAKSYLYTSASGKWVPSSTYGGGPKALCEAVARGEPPPPLPPFDKWARKAFATKGGRKDLGVSFCREWNIAVPRHNMEPERLSVCLGEDDELPRLFTQYDHESRIYDWNVPLYFEAPQIADPPPAAPIVKPLMPAEPQ